MLRQRLTSNSTKRVISNPLPPSKRNTEKPIPKERKNRYLQKDINFRDFGDVYAISRNTQEIQKNLAVKKINTRNFF